MQVPTLLPTEKPKRRLHPLAVVLAVSGALYLLLSLLHLGLGFGNGRPTALERQSFLLKPGMIVSEVDKVFANYEKGEQTNQVDAVFGPTKWHSTNRVAASRITYRPRGWGLWESCYVFFDTNNTIVAHYYSLIH